MTELVEATSTIPVTIIGVGGMGSRIAEGLVRMQGGVTKYRFTLIDGDTFATHNLANQLMSMEDAGRRKVDAVAEKLRSIRPHLSINTLSHMVTPGAPFQFSGIVFLCLDSMAARANIMKCFLHHNPDVTRVIETRMDSGVGVSYCFNPNNSHHLECWWLDWYPDSQIENVAGCGGKTSVISAVFGTTALALRQFEQVSEGKKSAEIPNCIYADFDAGRMEHEHWGT